MDSFLDISKSIDVNKQLDGKAIGKHFWMVPTVNYRFKKCFPNPHIVQYFNIIAEFHNPCPFIYHSISNHNIQDKQIMSYVSGYPLIKTRKMKLKNSMSKIEK